MEDKKYPNLDTESMLAAEPVASPSSGYNITRNNLYEMLSSVDIEDIPSAVKFLVDKLAVTKKESKTMVSHKWDDYKLSPEVIAMAPPVRKKLYGDYDAILTEILEEKYK